MKKHIYRKTLLAVTLLSMLFLTVITATAFYDHLQQKTLEKELMIQREKLRESDWSEENTLFLNGQRYGFDHRIETFLLIGTDDSGNKDPSDFRGAMADFLLLLVLDHTDHTIGFLQIDRNTVVEVRELTEEGEVITARQLQICTAHWYGRNPQMAAENTVYAVQTYLGGLAGIDGYCVWNMRDIGLLNHAVGGVEVTLHEDLTSEDPSMKKGSTILLSDRQAERFLRARMDVGEGTNKERMLRQQQYLTSLMQKIRSISESDPNFIQTQWNQLKDHAVTDMNGNDISRIANQLIHHKNSGIDLIEGTVTSGFILEDGKRHEEFYADENSKCKEMIKLFSLVLIKDNTAKDGDT